MTNQIAITPIWHTLQDLNDLRLDSQELHLWWLPLSLDSEQKKFAYSLLTKHQLSKYHRRTTTALQNSYLAGRYHLFTLMSAYLNCQPNDIKLGYNRLNKPFLKNNENTNSSQSLQFNFTDTTINNQSFALFAFCWDKQVGVDLEAQQRPGNLERIAKRRFTQHELDFVTNASGNIDPQKCLAIWTRKEAYGKARGIGINFQMNRRNLINPQTHHTEYLFNDEQYNWRLLQVQPHEDFIACVVHESHTPLSIKAFKSL